MNWILAITVLFVACQQPRQGTNLLREAEWQLYKFNLLEGDQICQIVPTNDSLLQSKKLYEYGLIIDSEVSEVKKGVIYRFFEEGVAPCHSYYYSIKFIGSVQDSIILNYGERGEIITSVYDGEEDFLHYLQKLPRSSMSPDLIDLAKGKGVFK